MSLWASLCTTLVSFILGSTLAMFLVPPLRSLPAQILVENDHPRAGADAIVLLMGDAEDRAGHAADLLRDGYADRIVFVETEQDKLQKAGIKSREGQNVYEYLTKTLKVPAAKISFDNSSKVTSTHEEIQALLKVLDANNFNRIVLVTSWYHSSRAAWIFRKVLAEQRSTKIQVASLPSPTPNKWYKREKDFLNVYVEYLKWVYYYFKYDVLA